MSTVVEKPRIYRKDYLPPPFVIESAVLIFDLDYVTTTVVTKLNIVHKTMEVSKLVLNGEDLDLKEVQMDGKVLSEGIDYHLGEVPGEPLSMSIPNITKDRVCIQIRQVINPTTNTQLSGVYKTNDVVISFNEPHGMRRICYWIDRPDNMTIYQVTLRGDKALFPVLLSNGNQTEYISTLPDEPSKHSATFVDPWPKGPHLFAICAGKLGCVKGTYRTFEGRDVSLEIYAEPQYVKQLDWALEVTKQAFKFDEVQYGRAYDLDVFRVVGVSDFNMGAMENKSLCVFNISALVATPKQSADRNYLRVLTVIGHEYFHNWSGNRVNVRDWFQITLKEGFTAYREMEFERWYYGEGAPRIARVCIVRDRQFAEDAGPNAHPIRPESYIDVDNFYTATLYRKGAEVIGMYKSLLGPEGYRKGTDYYFSTYDGQAISCDEFRNAMGKANGRDLSQFERWYTQRRTPHIQVVSRKYNPSNSTYTITLRQVLAADAGADAGTKAPQPLLIPVLIGLVGRTSGKDVIPTTCLELDDWTNTFVIPNVTEDAVPSVLRNFSAPVILDDFLEEDEIYHLMSYDSDDFNRWEAGQTLIAKELIRRSTAKTTTQTASPLSEKLTAAYKAICARATNASEYGMIAECLKLPTATDVCNKYPHNDPYALTVAKGELTRAIQVALKKELTALYSKVIGEMGAVTAETFDTTAPAVQKRSLSGVLLTILSSTEDVAEKERLVKEGYFNRATITEKEYAVIAAAGMHECQVRDDVIADFYRHCKGCDENTLDAWFILQACATSPLVVDRVLKLAEHPDYKGSTNPNRVRALLMQTLTNPISLLHPSGKGLDFAVNRIMSLDPHNPRLAAVQAKFISSYTNYDDKTIERMRDACIKMYNNGNCSFSLKEILEPAIGAGVVKTAGTDRMDGSTEEVLPSTKA